MLSVLIADDHEIVRRGIREILEDEFTDLLVGEASTGQEIVEQLRGRSWDLVLLDVMMPESRLIEMLPRIRDLRPDTRVLVLTAVSEPQYAVQAIAAGASGYITKRYASEELVLAVRAVLRGESFLSTEAAEALAMQVQGRREPLPHHKLSPREMEVFLLIARGQTVKEVAATLRVSDKTVATYMARIREKTNFHTHVDIARYALRQGLVD